LIHGVIFYHGNHGSTRKFVIILLVLLDSAKH
jgi:hypothetical protein